MKPKSLKSKFLLVLLIGAALISVAVGLTAFTLTNELLHEKADTILQTRCASEAARINDILGGIEQSLQITSWYSMAELDSAEALADPAYQSAYITHMLEMMTTIAQHTQGIVAYYLRFDPALTGPTAGFFINRTADGSSYLYSPPTDLSLYDPDDMEHVGWYWVPRNAGKAVWLPPYTNLNNGVRMVSYVIPLYHGSTFIGVVGMDIDFTYLQEYVQGIAPYQNGYAYLLAEDGTIIGTKAPVVGHETCIEASSALLNGMELTLHARYEDVVRESYPIVMRSLLVFVLLTTPFMLLVVHMTNRITSPLKKLTTAIRQMEAGETDVTIDVTGDDEIGVLARAFSQMATQVNNRMHSVSELAYRDSLTGVKSRLAYVNAVARIDQQLPEKADFGVLVMDANGLKHVNDSYGHDAGNAFICHIAHIVCDVYKHSPVFRFGGDEFVVILEGRDLADREDLVRQLDDSFAANPFQLNGESIPCVIAREVAVFNPETDRAFSDVFVRADKMMYQHKRRLKGLAD